MPGPNVWGSMSPLAGPSGIGAISAGGSGVVLTDPRIKATSIVIWVPLSVDPGNRYVASSVCIAGQCTMTLSGVTTGAQSWGYVIVNTDEVS